MLLRPQPQKVYVEVTTRCNLRCKMCVKFIEGSCIPEEDFSPHHFDKLLPSLPYIETLILNGIGEPLMHPHIFTFIEKARAVMGEKSIGFQSNGILLSTDIAEKLLKAGLSTICLSVDMIETKAGEHSFKAIQKATSLLMEAKLKHKPDFRIGLEVVVSRSNIHILPSLVQWACENEIDYIIASHLIRYDSGSEEADLFNPNSHGSVELFKKYQERAKQENTQIDKAQQRHRITSGTDLDVQEHQLLSDLRKEAKSLDIRLNLPALIERDPLYERAKSFFVEADDIAKKHGLDLDLPPLVALDERQCPFIEENAVCIAANGDITPCHYLWHTYSCRVYGEEIKVQKLSFGNLETTSLHENWANAPFRSFRKEAGEYLYTHCWNCTQGPCPELVSSDTDLGHDCFGSDVPCGHCQWNLGGVRCL